MILYDLTSVQPFSNAKYHGGGKFAQIIFNRMVERDIQFSVFYDSTRFIDAQVIEMCKNKNLGIFDISKMSFDDIHAKSKATIVFSILPKPYMFRYKTVGTIHDIRSIDEELDKYQVRYKMDLSRKIRYHIHKILHKYQRNKNIKYLRNTVSHPNFHPTTITLFTKYAIMEVLRDVKVLNMPVFMTPSYYMGICERKDLYDGKYILMLSGNRPVKNILRAIEALDNIFDMQICSEYKVIITGVSNSNLFKYKIRNIQQFLFKGYVEESDLESLYAHCSFLLFPSTYEGFGMPAQEAMYFGKPVIASSLTAIPEVCGNAAIYINPFSVSDIASKVLMLLSEKSLYTEYVEKSKNRFAELFCHQQSDIDKYIDYVLSLS